MLNYEFARLGQKYKIKGVVVAKDDSSFIVRDAVGVDTKIVLASNTSVKTKGGFFGGGDAVAVSQIVRGLNLEVEGRGDSAGSLSADKVRFGKDDFRVAQSIDSRVGPAEVRLDQAEQNAQRISGQIDELVAISNSARAGALQISGVNHAICSCGRLSVIGPQVRWISASAARAEWKP